jgi:two-component sensor histidine kinase
MLRKKLMRLLARLRSLVSRDAALSDRLTLLVLAGVVPLLLFNLLMVYANFRSDRARALHQTLLLSRAIARSTEDFLDTRAAELVELSQSRGLVAGDLDMARTRAERVLRQQFPGNAIILSRADGQTLMDTRVPAGVPLSDHKRPDRPILAGAGDRPTVSGVFLPIGASRPVVAIDLPIHNAAGIADRVLTLYIDLGAFAPLIGREKPADGWISAIIDENGLRVARSPPANLVARPVTPGNPDPWPGKPEATFEGVAPSGAKVFAAYSSLPDIGWRASVAVHTDLLTGPAWQSALLSVMAASGLLACGTLLQRKISRQITGPLASLHRIAAAPDSTRDEEIASTGMREADEVAQALIAEKRLRYEARASLELALEQRTAALGQRDLLLIEVYHRVKNNLQLVDGFLALQMSQSRNCEFLVELSNLRSRLYALGLVHQQLMSSADLRSFDIAPFLRELADNAMAAAGRGDCAMNVQAASMMVTLDFAIPLGLLVNELITNCFKHSYPRGGAEISIRLDRNAIGDVRLLVSSTRPDPPDAGTPHGLPLTREFSYQQGQGIEIITGLVAQIDGVMTIRDGNPYTTEVTIAAGSVEGD